MDRKLIIVFIAIYSVAASAGYLLGGADAVNVAPVNAEEPQPRIVRGEADETVATDSGRDRGEVSDIVQLPMIIIRPQAVAQGAADKP